MIVAGAGPIGLVLAGDLAAAGVPVTVVEKRAEDDPGRSPSFIVHARTLEMLDARGLADELVAEGQPVSGMWLFNRLTLHLYRLPSRFNYMLVIPQHKVDSALRRRATRLGARFEYGTEVTGLAQDADGVTVEVRGPDGERAERRAAYAVGADGPDSAVREAVGLRFRGRSVLRSVVVADVRLSDPPTGLLAVRSVANAFACIAPMGDGWHRVVAWHRGRDAPDSEPLELEEVQDIVRIVLGRDHGMHDARLLSRFHCDERLVRKYRVGRVFLAGDAAHVQTPAGGLGLNTGVQDAANLAWKLAAVLHGWRPEALLDTYQAERRRVARAVRTTSGNLVRLSVARWPWSKAVRLLVARVVSSLGWLHTRGSREVSAFDCNYRNRRRAHRMTGRRVPDAELSDGRLYEALRPGRFVLVTPPGTDAASAVAGREDRLTAAGWLNGRALTLLVRPDGYAAWAADGPVDAATLDSVVTEWAGTRAA